MGRRIHVTGEGAHYWWVLLGALAMGIVNNMRSPPKCVVLGCRMWCDLEFPMNSKIGLMGYFCRPHGLHRQTEEELWTLTRDRLRRELGESL